MFKKKVAYSDISKDLTSEVLSLIQFYPATARDLIKKNNLQDISGYLSEYLLTLGKSIDPEDVRSIRWQEIRKLIQDILTFYAKRPFKIFEFLVHAEIHRTSGRSYRSPISASPIFDAPESFPDAQRIFYGLYQRVTCSDKALFHWHKWLGDEFKRLSKLGPRSLSGYGINELKDERYSIPTNSWKKTSREKEYLKTPIRMRTNKADTVRQQMHILESNIKYGDQINVILTAIKKHPEQLNRPKSKRTILKILEEYQDSGKQIKTISNSKIQKKLGEFIVLLKNGDLKEERVIKTMEKYLKKRVQELHAQFIRINKKRDVFARAFIKQINNELSLLDLTPEMLSEFLLLVDGVSSGYKNKETLLTEWQKQAVARLKLLRADLEKLADWTEKYEVLRLANENIRQSNKQIWEDELLPQLQKLGASRQIVFLVNELKRALQSKNRKKLLSAIDKLSYLLKAGKHQAELAQIVRIQNNMAKFYQNNKVGQAYLKSGEIIMEQTQKDILDFLNVK